MEQDQEVRDLERAEAPVEVEAAARAGVLPRDQAVIAFVPTAARGWPTGRVHHVTTRTAPRAAAP